MPTRRIRPVCPAPASPVPRMGPVCTFPPGRPGLLVRLVCGRSPDASGNVELGALALLDAVGVGDLAPGVRTWLHDEVMGDKADRATTLAGYGIADAYTQTETDAAISRAIANVVDSAPAAFDTLKEISDWIGDAGSGVQAVMNQVANKVDKVPGKGLSTNDYDATEKGKVSTALQPADVVSPAPSAAAGKPADAKATGDALAARPTKAQLDAGWWSEWTITPSTYEGKSLHVVYGNEEWLLYAGDLFLDPPEPGTEDATSLTFSVYGVTATRHRVAAPVPTKPSDIGAQPAGSYATAAQGAKADAALSRAEAEAGFTEWKFSDGNTHTVIGPVETPHDGWIYGLDSAYSSVQSFSTKAEADAALDLEFAIVSVTATRIRLPTMADIPTKTSDLTNDSGFLTQHQQLTPVYRRDTVAHWRISPAIGFGDDRLLAVEYIDPEVGGWGATFEYYGVRDFAYANGEPDATVLSFEYDGTTYTLTKGDYAPISYTLGDQTTKPLQPQGEYAPATNIPKTALAQDVQTSLGKADTAVQPAALAGYATTAQLRYDIGTETAISSASSEVVEGQTVTYGSATLADRTANRVAVTVAIAELRLTFPVAVSGKVRDFGLRVEVGTGSAALTAPALVPPAGVALENADGDIPALADGTATAKGVTLLYFSETAPGKFLIKGEQVQEA